MQIQKSALETSVAGKVGDILQVPSSSREVGQAEMPEAMGAEFRNVCSKSDLANHFGPSPFRNGQTRIPIRNRD